MTRQAATRPDPEGMDIPFGKNGALRIPVGATGRVHMDRWLHFLLLHRGEGPSASLARRIAVESPAYMIWSESDDDAAAQMLQGLASVLADRTGRLLVITLEDQPMPGGSDKSSRLPPFIAELGAGEGENVSRAAAKMSGKLEALKVDLRQCRVEMYPFTPILPAPISTLLDRIEGVERLTLRVPQIHRRPDGEEFPAIAHEVSAAIGDAILSAACAFLDDGRSTVPSHYRALGRSAYLTVALNADRQIDAVAKSFDFLLSISPIDTAEAFEQFVANGEQDPPRLHYRPLTVDPDVAKRDLYDIDLRLLEDPTLERLLGEKRREIDAQLTMLATRNTPAFRAASMFLYGAVSDALLADARQILGATTKAPPRGPVLGAEEVAAAAEELGAQYRQVDPAFTPEVEIRDDVAGLLVSGGKLMIGSDTVIPAGRLEALLAHEVGIHLLTYFNGATQGLSIFRTGLAGYEGVQEGLGVFAEWATGGLTQVRLRLLAARVVAVDAMLHGAGFVDVYHLLRGDHGYSRKGAFGIAARVFRSGGLAKDAIYLQGYRAVMEMVSTGTPLDPFWLGKIAVGHAPVIEELLHRGLVYPPRWRPLFLDVADTRERIARLRADGLSNQLPAGARSQ